MTKLIEQILDAMEPYVQEGAEFLNTRRGPVRTVVWKLLEALFIFVVAILLTPIAALGFVVSNRRLRQQSRQQRLAGR